MGYLDTMYAMIKKCKLMAKIALEEGEREREKQRERERRGSTGIGGRVVRGPKGDGGAALAAMWRERGSRMALVIASQFIEMKVRVLLSLGLMPLTVRPCPSSQRVAFADHQEFTAATRLLAPLCTSSSPELRSAVGRIYLQAGLLDQALTEFNLVSESVANAATPSASAVASPNASPNLSRVGSQVSMLSAYQSQASGGRGAGVTQRHKNLINMNAALMASAQGDWVRAEEILRGLVAINPDDFVVSRSFWLLDLFAPPRPSLHRGERFNPTISVSLHLCGFDLGADRPFLCSVRGRRPPDYHHPAGSDITYLRPLLVVPAFWRGVGKWEISFLSRFSGDGTSPILPAEWGIALAARQRTGWCDGLCKFHTPRGSRPFVSD